MRYQAGFCLLLLLTGCQSPASVDTVAARVQPVQESFVEEAETRLSRTWPVTMPESGTIARIVLDPGDPVRRGQELVAFDRLPVRSAAAETAAQVREIQAQLALNAHTGVEQAELATARAQFQGAVRTVAAIRTEVAEARERLDQARVDYRRQEDLAHQEFATQKELEDARLVRNVAQASMTRVERRLQAAQAEVSVARARVRAAQEAMDEKALRRPVLAGQMAQAEARQARSRHDVARAVVRCPIDGVVLERYQQGPGPLAAGERLLLLGRRSDMEAVCEVLTQDAVKLHPGSPVAMQASSGGPVMEGRVKRTEPQAFTKLSALGVEQKRVRVIIGLSRVPAFLGVGFRLQARFVTARKAAALTVPRFAVLQAPDRSFFVYQVENGRLRQHPVTLGLQEDLTVEITAGLKAGDRVVAAPDVSDRDGLRVTVR